MTSHAPLDRSGLPAIPRAAAAVIGVGDRCRFDARPSLKAGKASRAPRRAGGFTLIEVLIATVLLAAGLTLAFATLGAATRSTQRGEDIAARSERLRAVEGFLRRRLEGARPVPFEYDPANGVTKRFEGGPDTLRFVADLPDYLGRGGPYLHEFAVVDGEDGSRRITVDLRMVLAGQIIEEAQPRPPELLAQGLGSARFRYRSLAPDGGLGEWLERWEDTERMPLLVEVTLTDTNGQSWPPLVVALPLAAGMAGATPILTQ